MPDIHWRLPKPISYCGAAVQAISSLRLQETGTDLTAALNCVYTYFMQEFMLSKQTSTAVTNKTIIVQHTMFNVLLCSGMAPEL